MNPQQKRYRQANLYESFGIHKKPRSSNMAEITHNRDISLAAAEQRLKSPSTVSAASANQVCNAADGTGMIENTLNKGLSLAATAKRLNASSTMNAVLENQICIAAEDSVKIKNEGHIEDSEKMSCEDDNAFETSADLFPESASLENYSIPSSSGSTELFSDVPDSQPQAVSEDYGDDSDELFACFTNELSSSQEDEISFLNRSPDCSIPLPKLEPLENHSVMFSCHIRPEVAPRPYPSSYKDRWDFDHVRMPCSPMNRYPVADAEGNKQIQSRWDLICQSLKRDITSSKDLEEAIMEYNSQYVDRWNFQGLHAFINRHLTEEDRDHFFEVILPVMIEIALDLPNICTQPIPLLKKGKDYFLTMSQKQIGCLLINAFFCTFPRRTLPSRRNRRNMPCEYSTYPDINFNRLFAGVKNKILSRNIEKLKCLFNYFRRIAAKVPTGTVTFHRQHLRDSDLPKWNESTRGIRTAVIKSAGLIETDGHGMLQVDFANKFVGGGVLGQGCVQEEIRFIICPELIVSRLFVECLSFTEVLIVTGVEQYSKYSGYADTFKFEGNFIDKTPRDPWGRRYTELVAMDATPFSTPADQFKTQFIRKELIKAYSGFYENALPDNLSAIATGNWGCGAFKGNANLKFLIQLMAASEAGRSLLYFTFGNKKLKIDLQNMYNFLADKNLAVGDVWRLLLNYPENVSLFNKSKYSNLYEFIYSQFLTEEENCRLQEDDNMKESLGDSSKKSLEELIEDFACDNSSTEIEDNVGS